jgi:hypothetical protein
MDGLNIQKNTDMFRLLAHYIICIKIMCFRKISLKLYTDVVILLAMYIKKMLLHLTFEKVINIIS